MADVTKARAEHIARSHPCGSCKEYSWKKLRVKKASEAHQKSLGEFWHATRICGVCGAHDDLGLDREGDVVYGGTA
ncbi:MAG TPA: hypothetical protein VNJ04_20035 [Gemmatimonadaceae bacterium]|nr:hypothetical protein [Gemmatimonadaceae bacterium]